ncbi:MAG: flagellar export protein FliJ [Hungatella sp.]|jgi:flagellar FliJ protein|nr:flagellar export protein FliJ [Hungatella sp.]
MKKFNFPLNTVLNYKDQALDNLKSEHAQILVRVAGQEKRISQMEEMRNSACIKLKEETETGIAINAMREYEVYIMNMEKIILAEQKILAVLKKKEEQKRTQVVEARKEKASIEKLKEKKLMQYDKEVQRSEELFIEEFVSNTMSVRNNR